MLVASTHKSLPIYKKASSSVSIRSFLPVEKGTTASSSPIIQRLKSSLPPIEVLVLVEVFGPVNKYNQLFVFTFDETRVYASF